MKHFGRALQIFLGCFVLAMGVVVAAPPVWNGSVAISPGGSLTLPTSVPTAVYLCNTSNGVLNTPCPTFPGAGTPFPSSTAIPPASQQALCIGPGGLTWGGTCTSPYPTPIPTSANANCTFASYTLTCTTPTPAPVPTSANANCAFALYVMTCVTPTPFPSTTALAAGGQQILCVTNLGALVVGGSCAPGAGTITAVNAGSNLTGGGSSGAVTLAVASPVLTTWPVTNCGAWSATFALQYFTCPATPYPTPIPTSANANCTWASYTMTCTTPTPKPDPTSANANCTFAVQVLTCVTPAPQNTNIPLVLIVNPTATSLAVGVVSEPVMLNSSAANLFVTGGAFVCDTAGSGGSAAAITWQTNTSNPAPADGTWATTVAVPTISAASNAKAAGWATFAAAAFPTDASAAHITWVRAYAVTAPTTPLSGSCRMELFMRQSTL